jgi:RNA-directed DNA polymerase
MVLDGLEQRLAETIRKRSSHRQVVFHPMINVVRYADDFIVTGSSAEVLERVKEVVREFLGERGLSLSDAKTRIVHIETGFDFLGQNVRMYTGKLLIKPSKDAAKKVLSKIRAIIRANKSAAQENLIRLLNPIIRGWTNYHRYAVSSRAFARFDYEVWRSLWQWATRRHPNKGRKWVRKRYFQPMDNRIWTFACEVESTERRRMVKLAYATNTKIRRHIKVQAAANPYDPNWEAYFEERLTRQMGVRLMENRKAWYLWLFQEGRCPECSERITEDSGWQLHHVIYRVHGGSDAITNLRLLHPNCHRKLHHRHPALPGSHRASL